MARSLGLTAMTADGETLTDDMLPPEIFALLGGAPGAGLAPGTQGQGPGGGGGDGGGDDIPSWFNLGRGGTGGTGGARGGARRTTIDSTPSPSPVNARKELQFHAMFLHPHQVELLFVLCTLLSGRRKIHVQKLLAGLGLGEVLTDMFARYYNVCVCVCV